MRFIIALGSLLTFVGCNSEPNKIASPPDKPVAITSDSDSAETAEFKMVSVKVTGMMCPHGCYPEVKSLITKKNDVESIELTPQEKKDVIDNPVILVKYRGVLNKEETTKAIIEAGFEKVEYTEQ